MRPRPNSSQAQTTEPTAGGVPSSPSLALYSPSAGGVRPPARNRTTGSPCANIGGDDVTDAEILTVDRESIPLAAHGSEKSRHPHSNSRGSSTREDTGTAGDLPANAVPVQITTPWGKQPTRRDR